MDSGVAVVLARFVFFVAASVAFGIALFPLYALRPTRERDVRSLRGPILAAAVVGLGAALAWLALAIHDFGGEDLPSFVTTGETVLFETAFGPAWLIRLAACAGLVLAAILWPRPLPLLLLATVLLGSEGWIGDAATGGVGHCVSQVVHLLSAGAWLGGLLPLGRALAEGARERAAAQRARRILFRFSAMGMPAVALIALSGIVNRLYVAAPVPALDTGYDRYVALKAALFLAMAGAALFNRFRLMPQLERAETRAAVLQWFWWTILLEQGLGLLLLLVASFLGVSVPPG